MKITLTKTLAGVAVAGWLGVQTAFAQPPSAAPQLTTPVAPPQVVSTAPPAGDDRNVGGGWFIQADAVLMHRDIPTVSLGIIDINNDLIIDVPDAEVSTKQLHFPWEPGVRLTVGCQDGSGIGLEGAYFGLQDSRVSLLTLPTLVPGAGGINASNLFAGFGIGGAAPGKGFLAPFDAALSLNQDYKTSFHSGELNARYTMPAGSGSSVSVLAGVRYVKISEAFDLAAVGTNTGLALGFPGTTLQNGDYGIKTENNLVGLQVGGDAHIGLAPGLALHLSGKAGLYDNFDRQHSSIIIGGALFADGKATGEKMAALTEFSASLEWWITPGLGLQAGYQGMFVQNLALAPDQIDFFTSPGAQSILISSGSAFYHGPVASLIVRW